MPTIEEQEYAILKDVRAQIEWAESYEECFDLIEKGKQKMKALTQHQTLIMSKKVAVIIGKAGSGKSTLAMELIKSRKHVQLTSFMLETPFPFEQVKIDTEVILIDEATVKDMRSSTFSHLCHSDKMGIRRQGKPSFIMKTPEIIVTSQATLKQLPKSISESTRYVIIACPDDAGIPRDSQNPPVF